MSRAGISTVDVLSPKVFIGLLVGAMLPYWFSAMTMKSVGKAALKMVEEVRRQFNTIPGLMEGTAKPDYATCVKISTDASIKEMIAPGALVMLTPLIAGILFGVETLSGVLAGALVSGVQVMLLPHCVKRSPILAAAWEAFILNLDHQTDLFMVTKALHEV